MVETSIPEHRMDTTEYLEITTHVGCKVNCKKYCPQEVLVQRYGDGVRDMSLDSFKQMISTVPERVIVVFSGFCEPFLNPNCIDLMEYAYQKGHRLMLNTTLVGMKLSDIDRLANLGIIKGILHLPDANGVAHIPITDEYKEILVRFLKLFPNMQYISMNDQFPTNNHENVTRGILPKRKWYPIDCAKLHTPQYILFPDGNVYACCMDFGLDLKLGNLLKETYQDIKKSEHLKQIKHDNIICKETLCRYCSFSLPFPVYHMYMITKNWYYNRKTNQQNQYKMEQDRSG